MSFVSKMFSGGKSKQKESEPSVGDAIQRLRGIEEMLNKKQEYLEKKVDDEIELIRKYGTKNKRAALQALKRKKRIESQLAQIDGTINTLETQRITLENAKTNTEVLFCMKTASDALKRVSDVIGIDKVEDIMEDVRESHEYAEELANALSRPFGIDVEDDDELLKELEDMEEERINEELLNTDVKVKEMPAVPSQPIAAPRQKLKKTNEDDEDMRELAQWAN